MSADRFHRDEDGMGLVVAMLATMIVAGMVVVFMTRTLTETRLSGSARDREAAIHVAEAGIDAVITHLNDDEDHLTTTPAGADHVYDIAVNATQAEERAWAVDVARTECILVDTEVGQACGIRPEKADGTKLPWVYGVGFVPDMANAEKTRVIKIQFDKGFFSPAKAILTQGDLTFGGTICGDAADVHTNANVYFTSNPNTVDCADPDGNVTSTGNYPAGDPCPTGTPSSVGCDSGQVDRTERIPEIEALTVYEREAATEAGRDDPSTTDVYEGKWFDLCVNASGDGEVRKPGFDVDGDPAPCTGELLYGQADAATFLGWSYARNSNSWDAQRSTIPNGVYYVYEANAFIRGSLGGEVNVTVLADARGEQCSSPGDDNGNIVFTGQGNGTFSPYLQDLLFLADRDLNGRGNGSGGSSTYEVTVRGVLLAHEQFYFGGTTTFTGAVISEGACDSPFSPISAGESTVTGNFHLTHSGDLALPLDSITRITAWNEL